MNKQRKLLMYMVLTVGIVQGSVTSFMYAYTDNLLWFAITELILIKLILYCIFVSKLKK